VPAKEVACTAGKFSAVSQVRENRALSKRFWDGTGATRVYNGHSFGLPNSFSIVADGTCVALRVFYERRRISWKQEIKIESRNVTIAAGPSQLAGELGGCEATCKNNIGRSRGKSMKPATLVGIVLIVLAVIAFAYQGISYTKREKVLDIGPIQATAEKRETIPIPPIVAGAALIGGIALLVVGAKN
jgi:hypothetical protein